MPILKRHGMLRTIWGAALLTAGLLTSVITVADSPNQIFEKSAPSVVVVEAGYSEAKGAFGSGVVIASGEVVTNCHVLSDDARIRVRHRGVAYEAQVRHSDRDRDLCQLTVPGLKARPVARGTTKNLKVGSRVYAIGAPKGLELTLSEGIVSSLRGDLSNQLIQTTTPISPGSSGGGLFDENARLVGLTTFSFIEAQNLNFAIPVEWIAELPARERAFARAPSSSTNWSLRAKELFRKKDSQALLLHSKSWVKAEPKEFLAWASLGMAHGSLEQWSSARDALEHALHINPEVALVWGKLGDIYVKLDMNSEAMDAYRKALRIDPENAEFWTEFGVSHVLLRQPKNGIEACQIALRINPELPRAWMCLGLAYGYMGNKSQAMEAYKRLRPLDANLADVLLQLLLQ